MFFLPQLLAKITGRDRYLPGIVWSDNSWTHNVFRLFELVFWKAYGPAGVGDTIRREAASWITEDGIEGHAFYTFEAAVAHFETIVRQAIKSLEMPKIRIYVPVMETAGMPFFIPAPTGYMFAIARDTTVNGSAGGVSTGPSWSHTCTGSNLILIVWAGTESSIGVSGITYNSAAMTQATVATQYTSEHFQYLYYKTGPSTGANTVQVTHASSTYSEGGYSISYTGAASAGQPDATAALSEASGTSGSTTITVVAANCWVFGAGRMDNGGTRSITNLTALSPNPMGDTANIAGDSNGTVSTGALTVGVSSTVSDGPTGVWMSIAPFVAAAATGGGTRELMGVG